MQPLRKAYDYGGVMIPRIKRVKPLDGYLLDIIFDDGLSTIR